MSIVGESVDSAHDGDCIAFYVLHSRLCCETVSVVRERDMSPPMISQCLERCPDALIKVVV